MSETRVEGAQNPGALRMRARHRRIRAAIAKEVQGGQGTEGNERGSVRFGYVTERATEETQPSAAHLQARRIR